MKKLTHYSEGFTVIELLVFILVVLVISSVGITNIRTLRAQNRDAVRKTDINAVYYQLESYYEKNGNYPEKLDTTTLKGIDPASLQDSDKKTFNEQGGAYSYKPSGCTNAQCKSYTLSAKLEKEADFEKESLNK